MRKTYFGLVLTAGILLLSGCAGPLINETHTTDTENAVRQKAAASVAGSGISSSDVGGSGTAGSDAAGFGAVGSDAAGFGAVGSDAVGSGKETAPPQMIYVRDTCMISAGRTAILTCGTADGTISSLTTGSERPGKNGQANFNCQGASYVSLAEGAAAVEIDGNYTLFLADDVVEYNGIYKKKSEVSEDTLKWLDFYYSLPERERNALSMVPSEFANDMFPNPMAVETESAQTLSYPEALSEEELQQTEALAQRYFTEETPSFEGVDQIYPLISDTDLYHNAGLEGEYAPGNIIIYKVLTVKDRRDGNPFRFISIARKSKSDDWKIINCGY